MCLAIPVQVEKMLDNDEAIVVLDGVRKQISLALVDDINVGDFVILHVGYALNKIDPGEAEATLNLFREMNESQAAECNPLLTLSPVSGATS